jgi:hypothetical protein
MDWFVGGNSAFSSNSREEKNSPDPTEKDRNQPKNNSNETFDNFEEEKKPNHFEKKKTE